jgi:hypothetical protein
MAIEPGTKEFHSIKVKLLHPTKNARRHFLWHTWQLCSIGTRRKTLTSSPNCSDKYDRALSSLTVRAQRVRTFQFFVFESNVRSNVEDDREEETARLLTPPLRNESCLFSSR